MFSHRGNFKMPFLTIDTLRKQNQSAIIWEIVIMSREKKEEHARMGLINYLSISNQFI